MFVTIIITIQYRGNILELVFVISVMFFDIQFTYHLVSSLAHEKEFQNNLCLMIPPLGREHSHGKTQCNPENQVLVRSWLWKTNKQTIFVLNNIQKKINSWKCNKFCIPKHFSKFSNIIKRCTTKERSHFATTRQQKCQHVSILFLFFNLKNSGQ